ncbi:F-box/RNI-like superfamily protein [Prunus dulcis]|uniref:F-box/RNI-like superfamily protein n=1 Tax=Prunus dulcis TaxID=3755 RepID=A0A4Y1QRJ0_PRUDU|nr:F-box/RNI-like superfamily protein [Prunus dulcis]
MEPWDKNMKKKRKRSRRPVRLRCSVKNYDWGIVGRHSKVARLFALNSGSDIDPAKPYAEFWIGTHESGPSYADSGSEPVSLKAWIAQDPSVLGTRLLTSGVLIFPSCSRYGFRVLCLFAEKMRTKKGKLHYVQFSWEFKTSVCL